MSVPLHQYVHEIMLLNILCGNLSRKDFDADFQLYLQYLMNRGTQMLDVLQSRPEAASPPISFDFLRSMFATELKRFKDLQDLMSTLLHSAIKGNYYVPKEMMDLFRGLGELMKHMLT